MHCGIYSIAILDTISLYNIFEEQYKDTVPIAIGNTFFAVEPFGYELPSGLSLRVEDKAEWLRRNE